MVKELRKRGSIVWVLDVKEVGDILAHLYPWAKRYTFPTEEEAFAAEVSAKAAGFSTNLQIVRR